MNPRDFFVRAPQKKGFSTASTFEFRGATRLHRGASLGMMGWASLFTQPVLAILRGDGLQRGRVFLLRQMVRGDLAPNLEVCGRRLRAALQRRIEKARLPTERAQPRKFRDDEHAHECRPSFHAPTSVIQRRCQFGADGQQGFVWLYAFSISSLICRSTCAGMFSCTDFR